jgi:hypothetical protein
MAYTFSRREIARHRCRDCGVNVIKAGHYFMLQSEIWQEQFKLGWSDNLCLDCIEKRLGRRLCFWDFLSLPLQTVSGYPPSDALEERLATGGPKIHKAKPRKAAREQNGMRRA